MTPTRPALRYHGGKFRLAPWIQQFFPPHGCYVEPFGGAASVLLHKPRVYAEVYNDLDGDIVNFFRVLRDPARRADLIAACRLTPYARAEFDQAYQPTDDPVEQARRTCIRAAMGFGSAGATKATTGFRTDTRRKYGTAQHNWAAYPESLHVIGERFMGVLIEQRDAVDVIQAHDGADTLHYVDPPYVHSTRNLRTRAPSYRHELDDSEHRTLASTLRGLKGMVIVSGYRSELYDELLGDWRRVDRAAMADGAKARVESLWLSPSVPQACLFEAAA